MLKLQTTHIDTILEVFSDKVLFDGSMPDEDRVQRDAGTWEPDPHGVWNFLEIVHNGEIVGLIRYQPISVVAIDFHVHVLSKYWGSHISNDIMPAFEEYIKNNTKYHKLQIQSPACCLHIIKCAADKGFEIEGVLMGAALWNSKIENLVLMGKFIRRI